LRKQSYFSLFNDAQKRTEVLMDQLARFCSTTKE
jgi:hypothetical protein